MDQDLRALERRAAADPDLLPLLRQARERAGLGRAVALPSVEQLDLQAAVGDATRARWRFRDGRRAHAAALQHALGAWVAGAFADHPGLQELTIDWRLRERRDRPWTVALRVDVPVGDRRRPPRRRNALSFADARTLEQELLGLAHLFPRRFGLFGARRLARDPARDLVVEEPPREDDRAGAEREVPLRRIEELNDGLREVEVDAGRTFPLGSLSRPGARPFVGTRAGAALLLEGALLDVADDDAELLERGGAAWDRFLGALFAEHRELDLFAVVGWTSGYNDNWHDEHDQRLHVSEEALQDLLEDWGPTLPAEVARALEARAGASLPPGVLDALRRGLDRSVELSVFSDFLRLRHGHDWLLVVRRDGDHVVERLVLRPEAPPP